MAARYRLTNDTIFTHAAARLLARAGHRDIAGVITSAQTRDISVQCAIVITPRALRTIAYRDRLPGRFFVARVARWSPVTLAEFAVRLHAAITSDAPAKNDHPGTRMPRSGLCSLARVVISFNLRLCATCRSLSRTAQLVLQAVLLCTMQSTEREFSSSQARDH